MGGHSGIPRARRDALFPAEGSLWGEIRQHTTRAVRLRTDGQRVRTEGPLQPNERCLLVSGAAELHPAGLAKDGTVALVRRGPWAVPVYSDFSAYAIFPHRFGAEFSQAGGERDHGATIEIASRSADAKHLNGTEPHMRRAAAPVTMDDLRAVRDAIHEAVSRNGGCDPRVFGSVAKGRAGCDSDIDFLVTLLPGRGLMALGRIQTELEGLLRRPVDVSTAGMIRTEIREEVMRSAQAL